MIKEEKNRARDFHVQRYFRFYGDESTAGQIYKNLKI